MLHDSDNPAEQEVSEIISSLRKEGLLTKKNVEPPNVVHGKTPYERTKHLLEVLTDLPADLSTNPKYLEGFGQ
ncbi:MAG TPA: hypothetical protein VFH95_08960 [Candidatus Kapabacteria bacterium]|nr:hypothetical protein [Candidatus Kapabacteria bacterium]